MKTLAQRLQQRSRRELSIPKLASVLVPIVAGPTPSVILTRRTETLPTHKGQVSFPGGGREPQDVDSIATALREAHEEIGLPPSAVKVLGVLDDWPTQHETVRVTPVVGCIPTLPPLRPQPSEVARIFQIPLTELRRPERWQSSPLSWKGLKTHVYFFDHDGETVWGLTARILLHMLAHTEAGGPFPEDGAAPTVRPGVDFSDHR